MNAERLGQELRKSRELIEQTLVEEKNRLAELGIVLKGVEIGIVTETNAAFSRVEGSEITKVVLNAHVREGKLGVSV